MIARLTRWWYRRQTSAAWMRDYLDVPLPGWNDDARHLEYLALDLETTGLDPSQDQIISVGWVPIIDRRVRLSDAQHRLVSIDGSVQQSAAVHHLRDSDLSGGCTEEAALRAVLLALAGRVLLVHHAPVDLGFLHAACRRHGGVPLPARVVDTLALAHARKTRGDHEVREGELRLHALRAEHNLPHYPAHDALTDALATAELFLAMLPQWAGDAPLPLKTIL